MKGFIVVSQYFFLPKIAPPNTLPCPSICLVAEYITTSAPKLRGFCKIGVAKTLSTTTKEPFFFAIFETASMSIISKHGFDGVSKKIIFVFFLKAFSQQFKSLPSISSTSIPNFGSIFVRI